MSEIGYRIQLYSDIRYNIGLRSLSPISLITDIGLCSNQNKVMLPTTCDKFCWRNVPAGDEDYGTPWGWAHACCWRDYEETRHLFRRSRTAWHTCPPSCPSGLPTPTPLCCPYSPETSGSPAAAASSHYLQDHFRPDSYGLAGGACRHSIIISVRYNLKIRICLNCGVLHSYYFRVCRFHGKNMESYQPISFEEKINKRDE